MTCKLHRLSAVLFGAPPPPVTFSHVVVESMFLREALPALVTLEPPLLPVYCADVDLEVATRTELLEAHGAGGVGWGRGRGPLDAEHEPAVWESD